MKKPTDPGHEPLEALPLFAKARARSTDPETSKEAAVRVEVSGVAGDQRYLCHQAVLRHPGMTAAEVAEVTGLERHAPSRRLPELRDERLVRCGEPRTCRVTGTRCITWWPADRAHREAE